MKDIEIQRTRTVSESFNAKIKATRARMLKKVCQHKATIKDGYEGHYRTAYYIYLPKLTPKHPRPVLMFTMTNGGGTSTMRTNNPKQLQELLLDLSEYLSSNAFNDNWERLNEIADQISNNTILVVDDKFIDRKQFEKFVLED